MPETTVRLGSSLDPETIREGTDVYFDCIVQAHPGVYKVEWRHNVGCEGAMKIYFVFLFSVSFGAFWGLLLFYFTFLTGKKDFFINFSWHSLSFLYVRLPLLMPFFPWSSWFSIYVGRCYSPFTSFKNKKGSYVTAQHLPGCYNQQPLASSAKCFTYDGRKLFMCWLQCWRWRWKFAVRIECDV